MEKDKIKFIVNSEIDSARKALEEKIDNKLALITCIPLKYWYPTIITVVAFTAGLVYWYFNQTNLINERISKIELKQTIDPSDESIVESFKYFYNIPISNTPAAFNSTNDFKDLAFTLTSKRKDLVVIITGYSKDINKNISKENQYKHSDAVITKIGEQLISEGVEKNRIFLQSRGPDVPPFFPGEKNTYNACVMLCDLNALLVEFSSI